MKEKPIIFNGPMIRAILDDRKSMTRRVVKPQPDWLDEVRSAPFHVGFCWPLGTYEQQCGARITKYPYGKPGHRLWVRETWSIGNGPGVYVCKEQPHITVGGFHHHVFFRADYSENTAWGMYGEPKWKPSIHMPRSASRITLEITGIRVERVQDISEADARSEGVEPYDVSTLTDDEIQLLDAPLLERGHPYRNGFALLWESLNEKRGYGWASNCWVWVIEFRRI